MALFETICTAVGALVLIGLMLGAAVVFVLWVAYKVMDIEYGEDFLENGDTDSNNSNNSKTK